MMCLLDEMSLSQLAIRLRRDAASMEHGHAQEDVRLAARILEKVAGIMRRMLEMTRNGEISEEVSNLLLRFGESRDGEGVLDAMFCE